MLFDTLIPLLDRRRPRPTGPPKNNYEKNHKLILKLTNPAVLFGLCSSSI